MDLMFSVSEQTRGSSVLLTGSLGFLGSVCLEQLLRLTEVKTVYLLVRGKRSVSAAERVEKLLCGALFHQLHKEADAGRNAFSKIRVIEGDLSEDGMGLQESDKHLLIDEVDMVIHCAANLTLEAAIQNALRSNYCSTRNLLQLAGQMPYLRSFVFTSTYWVNNFKPYNTRVKEEVHHVTLQPPGHKHALSHSELVDLLLSLPSSTADKEAAGIMGRLNFTSTYAFSKLLVEQMLDDPNCLPGVAKAIVRPSLITSVAGAPYPGYFCGFAGSHGYCLGYGMGFMHSQSGIAFSSDHLLDAIPADTTAALLIAAVAAGAHRGPCSRGGARVFHACSTVSHPCSMVSHLQHFQDFWTANPLPFTLPLARFPTITGRHIPTARGLKLHNRCMGAKVWLAGKLLQLTGKRRAANSLVNSFKAFCIQNTLGYARSVVCSVDKAVELRESIVAEERADWPCVWQQGESPDWLTYDCMYLTGLRCLAFKLPVEGVKTVVPHNFRVLQGLSDPAVMQDWMDGASRCGSSSSNSAAGVVFIEDQDVLLEGAGKKL